MNRIMLRFTKNQELGAETQVFLTLIKTTTEKYGGKHYADCIENRAYFPMCDEEETQNNIIKNKNLRSEDGEDGILSNFS